MVSVLGNIFILKCYPKFLKSPGKIFFGNSLKSQSGKMLRFFYHTYNFLHFNLLDKISQGEKKSENELLQFWVNCSVRCHILGLSLICTYMLRFAFSSFL